MLVGDNEHVKAGQVLARIDDRDFQVALDQAKADVAAAEAAIASKQAQLDVQQAVIDAAKATIEVDKATATFAAQENKRYTDLAATGYGSVQNAQQAQSRIAGAQAAIARDTANLASALKQVDLLKAEIAQANAALARAQAVQRQAELNLGYTTIIAPIDGVVGNRTLRVGQFVQAGTQLMSVVPVDGAYVVANFKETQLTDVHQGQAVDIEVDMFPGQVVHGHVDSIAPASGQEFALLPPDNATGNFTKVVQRIPVKIVLDGDDNALIELRPGMSVIPTIETRSQARDRRGASPQSQTLIKHGFRRIVPCQIQPFSLDIRASDLARQIGATGRSRTAPAPHLDRRARRHDRLVHGDPEHPDHQRLAAQYRRRHRHRRRQRLLDLDLVSDRRDHRDPADRLSQPGVLVPPLHAGQRRAVRGVLGGLRLHP